MFNIPKLSIVTIINLEHILDKIRASYIRSKKENLSLRVRDGLLKL